MDGMLGKFKHVRQRQKRSFSPKVRTGCQSCKQARVKCDESKPICEKCIKRQTECHYEVPMVWISQSPATTSSKERTKRTAKHVARETQADETTTMLADDLPPSSTSLRSTPGSTSVSRRMQSPPALTASTVSRSAPLSIHHMDTLLHVVPVTYRSLTRSLPSCTDWRHLAALRYFLEVPAPKVAYSKTGSFFTTTLPQAVWTHPAILESMIALATMCASLRGTSTTAWTNQSPAFHYSKAISTVARSKPVRHVTLLVCMLLWLYEQFDNQHTRAMFHRASGAKLLAEWRTCEVGKNRTTDDYIASSIEPAFLTGFRVTAPVKLCREVMAALSLLVHTPIANHDKCTYDESVSHLRACIEDFLNGQPARVSTSKSSLIRTAFASLRTWDHQFEHYTGSAWATEGPVLLSYATTVAMLVQKRGFVSNHRDADWHRAADFLLDETASEWCGAAHRSLLEGVAPVAGEIALLFGIIREPHVSGAEYATLVIKFSSSPQRRGDYNIAQERGRRVSIPSLASYFDQ
ncbi:hypothetical protein CLCR_01495 [Cladophialophora carrionii]|uniref:Zn(2)-C6 fungal-type domain-containing protein n=1 Tax=Cladophialophora carrionii TaxID=86049 RepID=A0A1C1CBL0_9EURO|nr:hypothetical protein CLCR_01495 [Cladophialophora carrionii]